MSSRSRGQPHLARATLEHAVRIQPSNPQPWLALGRYELRVGDPASAARERCRRRSTSTPSRSPRKRSPTGAAQRSKHRTTTSRRCGQPRRKGKPRARQRARRSKARTKRVREQQRARAGRPSGAPHLDLLEAELPDQPGERVAAVEAQVIAERVEVRGERAPGEREAQQLEASVRGRARSRLPPERSTRRTSESQAAVSATCSITSPAQTTSKLASASCHGASAVDAVAARAQGGARARGAAAPRRRRCRSPRAPARASSSAKRPSPQPTSSTRSPGRTRSSRKRLRSTKPDGSSPAGRRLPELFVVLGAGHRPRKARGAGRRDARGPLTTERDIGVDAAWLSSLRNRGRSEYCWRMHLGGIE